MTPPSVEMTPHQSRSVESHGQSLSAPLTLVSPPLESTPRKRLYRWAKRFGWVVIFSGTALASALGGALFAASLPLPSWLAAEAPPPLNLMELWQSGFRYQVTRPVNILVMGVDLPDADAGSDTLFSGRADTILVTRINPETGSVDLLSIPRDTQVNIPGQGIDKINHANFVGGPELVTQTIQANLGPAPIDRYVSVSTGALRELVDLLGGVEVQVPQRMVYTDETQGLYIDLESGWQTLNGDQAEQFARFRADGNGDIGRVQRQQILLKALRDRLTHPTVIPRLPQIMRVMLRYVDTNLTVEEVLALVNFAMEIEPDDLHMVMLPGRFSAPEEYVASYWILEPVATQQIMSQFFQLDAITLLSLDEIALLSDTDSQSMMNLPIAVQNASGEEGVAYDVAEYLRDQGFRRVYIVPDWFSEIQRTQVIAQRGDLDSASILASLLEVGKVVSDSTGDLESELTVRIGRDWTMQEATLDENDWESDENNWESDENDWNPRPDEYESPTSW
ncbi:MAG: LCP family protein [Cyanobacteria bacterium P01_F01_bin.86]